jgi:putative molybdopterin biosynthesis protein
MDTTRILRELDALKIIGDPIRLEILRLLMKKSATLSQIGEQMGMHPARIRYHLKKLETAGLVEFNFSREVRGFVEKYYRSTAQSFFINQIILPKLDEKRTIVALGSHDPALELLADHFAVKKSDPNLVVVPVGSLDGLVALRQGFCHLAGCHLYDPIGKEYNTSFVRHFFPGQRMHVVTLAHRLQGLVVAPGNPLEIKGLEDLRREDVNFINRRKGSGTRLWLDQELKDLGIQPSEISGYGVEVNTHSAVAESVLSGTAQLGLAVLAAARKSNLHFIPLFEERFDLVIQDNAYESDLLTPAMEYLQTQKYRHAIQALGGYDAHDTGKTIHM